VIASIAVVASFFPQTKQCLAINENEPIDTIKQFSRNTAIKLQNLNSSLNALKQLDDFYIGHAQPDDIPNTENTASTNGNKNNTDYKEHNTNSYN